MPTPDDARAGLRAVLNQVPPTMEATRIVLQHLASLTSVLSDEGEISIEKLHELIARWAATVTGCVIVLENKIERQGGRPGLPDDAMGRILSEFLSR